MRIWNFEIRWVTPQKEVVVNEQTWPFPEVKKTPAKKVAKKVAKKTTRKSKS